MKVCFISELKISVRNNYLLTKCNEHNDDDDHVRMNKTQKGKSLRMSYCKFDNYLCVKNKICKDVEKSVEMF